MKRLRSLRAAAAVALATVAGVGLAACSSSGTSSSDASTATPTTAMSSGMSGMTMPAAKTVVDLAASNADFSTLVAAVKAAGLADTLSGTGPFTVFAPTNEAFAQIPKATLDSLLKPENKDKLARILKYHVVAGMVMAADVKPGKVTTVDGTEFTISVEDGKVFITDGQGSKAQVVKTDLGAGNGVVHVIDKVLMPPAS